MFQTGETCLYTEMTLRRERLMDMTGNTWSRSISSILVMMVNGQIIEVQGQEVQSLEVQPRRRNS